MRQKALGDRVHNFKRLKPKSQNPGWICVFVNPVQPQGNAMDAHPEHQRSTGAAGTIISSLSSSQKSPSTIYPETST